MKQKIRDIAESSMCMPITEEGAKKILTNFNKVLKWSSDKKVQISWEYWEQNIDVLAKWVVKMKCDGIIKNEQSNW